MQFEGSVQIPSPRRDVWRFVTDPAAVAHCLPGLVKLEVLEPGKQFQVTVIAELGAVRPTFDLNVTFTLAEAPREARLRIRGKGAGSYLGASSFMVLDEVDASTTEMQWSFVAAASGQIASLGARLLEEVFEKVSGQFLERVAIGVRDSAVREPVPLRRAV